MRTEEGLAVLPSNSTRFREMSGLWNHTDVHRERFPVHKLLLTSWKLTRIFLVRSYVMLIRGKEKGTATGHFGQGT